MFLYHYTTLSSFQKIWESKKLLFSYGKNTNDFFEREKSFTVNKNSFIFNGKIFRVNAFDTFRKSVAKEIDNYKQVSFCLDYSHEMPGFTSPMMWGQYARSKNNEGKWQNGVCIKLEYKQIIKPFDYIYENKVAYPVNVETPYVTNIDFEDDSAAAVFVEKNVNLLFFTKHKHWEHENEYRFVSKYAGFLDIANAIIGVYVLNDEDSTLKDVENIIKDDSLINIVNIGGIHGRHLCESNLKRVRDERKLLRKLNESGK